MVRLTERPDMTLDFYRGRKTTTQQQQQQKQQVFDREIESVLFQLTHYPMYGVNPLNTIGDMTEIMNHDI